MKITDPNDPESILELCLYEASNSDCQKMGWGCVAVADFFGGPKILYSGANKRMSPLSKICPPGECIRESIPSRTESMIGACAHAEELALWKMIEYGYAQKLPEVQLYVAGVRADGAQIEHKLPEFTCARCAVQMFHARIIGINVWFQDKWMLIHPYTALQQAMKYAIGVKSV